MLILKKITQIEWPLLFSEMANWWPIGVFEKICKFVMVEMWPKKAILRTLLSEIGHFFRGVLKSVPGCNPHKHWV